MATDPYSPCPGGLNKKIKFCCPDLFGDWQKIDRMLEGQQFSACLKHVESLAAEHPGRACLLATKAMLLRREGRMEEAEPVVAEFLQKFPDNPIALAESAFVKAASQGGAAALESLERALAASGREIDRRVYHAMTFVAESLLVEGHFLAARNLATSQLSLDEEDEQPLEFLVQCNRSRTVPLILKEQWILDPAPEGAAWKAEFDEALASAGHMQWRAAAARLQALAERFPQVPAVWRRLAVTRAAVADEDGAIEALHKFASLDVPLDEAVEAETLALHLSSDPLGDTTDVVALQYTVQNVEELQTALLSSPRLAQMAVHPEAGNEGEPPPKAACYVLDRAVPLTHAGLTEDAIPRVLCHAMLFGRQTDREARLEVSGVVARDLPEVKRFLNEVSENRLGPSTAEENMERISATRESLVRNWRLPNDITGEHFQQLSEQHWEKVLLERFPQQGLPYLDGKSPQEAASQPAYRAKVLAVLGLLEFWIDLGGVRFDVGRIRERLGLPAPEPIDLGQESVRDLPLVRLARVMVEKLPDDDLLTGFERALTFAARQAVKKFAREVAGRPSLSGRKEQQEALMVLAQTEENWEQAYGYLEQGRKAAQAAGRSCAPWDLLELPARFQRGEGQQAVQLIQHLHGQHGNEPGVVDALMGLLMRFGVVRPDGTLAVPMARQAQEPSIVVPGQETQEPGKLWTPDGQRPAGEKPALWTPDMG